MASMFRGHAANDRLTLTTPRSRRKGLITVRTWREGEEVVIAIADSGGGIPDAIRSRVFDPFFTTKKVGKGTGQGLAIAWSTVRDRHSGSLTFESTPGSGTTFFIRLPILGTE
jgi:two-component system NtrC family sensor kinase